MFPRKLPFYKKKSEMKAKMNLSDLFWLLAGVAVSDSPPIVISAGAFKK